MGLLDALLSGDTGGGLLDFLRNNAMNQQAPAGLPSDQAQYGQPMNAMAQMQPQMSPQMPRAMPQQNAQPSPLDNAQWPAGPVGAPMQANAQMPPQQPQPPQPQQPQDSGLGIGDRLGAGFRGMMANAPAGPLGMLFGAGAGLAGMGQGNASNLTAKALLAKGVDPAAVQAAIGNPELMKTLVTQVYGPQTVTSLGDGYVTDKNGKITRAYTPEQKDNFVTVQTGEDGGGNKIFQKMNKATGELTPIANAAAASGRFSVDPELTGPARLDALKAADPLYARKIEALVNGDLPMPTGVAALRPESKRMIEDALAVDNATSASDFQTRAATRKDYASGIASRVTKSINTTIGHFATLDQSIDKLGNYSYFPGITNYVHDKVASNIDPQYQKSKATFETNKEAAIKELDFALSGGHSSVSGSAELRDKFNRADSPEALHAAVTEAMSLLQKRLQSHAKAFTEGTKSQRDAQDFIYPENQQAFGKLLGEPEAAAPGAAGASALQPGQSTKIGGISIKRVN